MKSINSKSLVTKSLVRTGIIVASLALAGNAFAANDTHVATNALRGAHPAQTQVTRNYNYQQPEQFAPVAQIFGGLFGLPLPVAGPIVTHAARDTGGDSGYDPTFDTPIPDTSASDANGWAIEQNAQDAAAAAMQEEDQSLDEMNASNAAAAAQNAAAEDMINQDMMNQVNSQ